jgi:hypothetical protein
MKHQKDIEKQLTELKNSYQVPDGYFDNLQFRHQTQISGRQKIYLFSKKWMIAAGLLLFAGLGYRVFLWQQNRNLRQKIHPSGQMEIITRHNQTDDFYDLTDDDIIEYLLDDDISFDEL